jgi:hypothetical protein
LKSRLLQDAQQRAQRNVVAGLARDDEVSGLPVMDVLSMTASGRDVTPSVGLEQAD